MELRSDTDRTLATELLLDPTVRKVRDELERAGKLGTRRSLLARALRLTPKVAPGLHESLDACVERLAVDAEVELYVHASAAFNAGCTPVEDGRVFILVTSALLEAFSDDELIFVLGHELGHHVYGHHAIPLGFILQQAGQLSPALVLKAHRWQRHAEISADRAGMVCCGGLPGASRALFKLSSGLREAPGPQEIDAFIQQAHALYEEHSTERVHHADWLSTHPFSPVRLRTAQSFQRLLDGEATLDQVEGECAELLALMEASYLEEDSDSAEAMRRLLFAAGAVVAGANGEVTREELEALSELLGPGRVPRTLDTELLATHLPARIEAARRSTPSPRRVQLVRDLAVLARADGHLSDSEVAIIRDVALQLEVDQQVVEVILSSPVEVD